MRSGHEQVPDGYRKVKATRARTARIYVENSPAHLVQGTMRMTTHNGMKARCGYVEIQVGEVMNHEDARFADFEHSGSGKGCCPRVLVRIAANCGHGRNAREVLQDVEVADVARMNDEVAATKRFERLGTEQPVCVRDEPNAEVGGRHGRPQRH
jgi:hypothetical protein